MNDTPVASQDITVEQKEQEQLPEIQKLTLRDQVRIHSYVDKNQASL